MELQLDRKLANKRVYPAVDITASSTRRDDLLQDESTVNRMWILRKYLADRTLWRLWNLSRNVWSRHLIIWSSWLR